MPFRGPSQERSQRAQSVEGVRANGDFGLGTLDDFNKSSGLAQCIVLKVNASVRKLLSTIEAHFVSPARDREWPAYVAVPAPKEPLEDGLYAKFHSLLPWQFVLHFRAPSCMRTLAFWVKENSSAVGKVLRNYRVLIAGRNQPWQSCFDHAAPSECSMRASPTVSSVGSITIL